MSGKVLLEKLSFPKKLPFIFSLLIGICFWSNLALDINPWGTRWAYPLVFIYCLILLFDKSTEWKSYKWEFAGVLKWTIITLFLSFIPAYIDWNQSILLSLQASIKYTWILFIYFILRRWNIGTSYIMKYIIILSIICVIIEIGQQLYRFYIWGVDFVMIAFAYCVGLLAQRENKFSINLLCLGTIFLIGLLCYCSRKHIYVSLLTIGIVSLSIKSKYRNLIRFVFALLVFAIIYNFYADFAEMNEQSIEAQGEGEDFIRFLALDYYLFKFSDSPLYFWLGSGIPSISELGRVNTYAIDVLKFYRADIGIFGYYSLFGIIGTLPFIFYIWKFLKNWNYIDLWFKLFFIMKLILIVFDFWGNWNVGMMAYVIFLYMLELNIQKNKGQRVKT